MDSGLQLTDYIKAEKWVHVTIRIPVFGYEKNTVMRASFFHQRRTPHRASKETEPPVGFLR